MMWCRRVRGQLSAYLDGELPLDAARRVEEHLDVCEGCRSERASIRQLTSLTALIPAEDVPTGLHSRILSGMTQLRSAPAGPGYASGFSSRAPVRPSLWFAIAGSMAIVVYGVFLNQSRLADESVSLPSGVSAFRSMSDPKPVAGPSGGTHAAARDAGSEATRAPRATSHSGDAVPEGAVREKRQAAATGAVPGVRPDRKRPAASPPGEARPQPVAGNTPPPEYDPGAKPFDSPAPLLRTDRDLPGMVGDPVVNAVATSQTDPGVSAVDKEPTTRMAGMMAESGTLGEEDEGLRSLRMFLEERNRMVPQPPALMPRSDRPTRKSL